MSRTDALDHLLARGEALLAQVERSLQHAWPGPLAAPDWAASPAFRYRSRHQRARLEPVTMLSAITLADLKDIDAQKDRLVRNTAQFVQGLPANNVLLTGARGTGKSSLIKACLNAFAAQGLRLIEMDRADLVDLPDVVSLLAGRPERFIVFSDDLSFEDGDAGYKALKSVLDGSVAATGDNVLVYATSNRRHLLPEYMKDNESYTHTAEGEIHPGEVVEEKISLSERFGLWLSFYPFSQAEYLHIVAHWLQHYGAPFSDEARNESLVFALERGSRSGRVAYQFARDYAGRAAAAAAPQPAARAASSAAQASPAPPTRAPQP
ncbi:MAG: ATP-binding protein [Betaproteobacteria bacterium]|nr:ATP-binding protein [Betaproteobacteria bacterium]